MEHQLKQPGIYLVKNGIQEAIVKIEKAAPFFAITALMDLTQFCEKGRIIGNDKLQKDIERNSEQYLFQPLDVNTVIEAGTTNVMINKNIDMTNEDARKYGDMLQKLGVVRTKQALMHQYCVNTLQTDVYLAYIRDFNGLPFDYNGPSSVS